MTAQEHQASFPRSGPFGHLMVPIGVTEPNSVAKSRRIALYKNLSGSRTERPSADFGLRSRMSTLAGAGSRSRGQCYRSADPSRWDDRKPLFQGAALSGDKCLPSELVRSDA